MMCESKVTKEVDVRKIEYMKELAGLILKPCAVYSSDPLQMAQSAIEDMQANARWLMDALRKILPDD